MYVHTCQVCDISGYPAQSTGLLKLQATHRKPGSQHWTDGYSYRCGVQTKSEMAWSMFNLNSIVFYIHFLIYLGSFCRKKLTELVLNLPMRHGIWPPEGKTELSQVLRNRKTAGLRHQCFDALMHGTHSIDHSFF